MASFGLVSLVCLWLSLAPQEAIKPRVQAENASVKPEVSLRDPEFVVDFDARGRRLAPGLFSSINDFPNADPGCWKAYGESLSPRGGLARIWIRYPLTRFGDRQVRAARLAGAMGLDVMVCVVGAPEHYAGATQDGAEAFGKAPLSVDNWTTLVARDVTRMINGGGPVTHVEIWNEPDLPRQWHKEPQDFAEFFVLAGLKLQRLLPDLKIGGPGMANSYGANQKWFKLIYEEAARQAFQPDFISFHDYLGNPADQAAYGLPGQLQELAREAGLEPPQLILSEWNITLPRPRAPELDDHRAGVYFISFTSSLTRTPVEHACFFLLQDGTWETQTDYAGESVGVFTINGGPKALLPAMRMCQKATRLPAMPVRRGKTPWNLTLLASRFDNQGFVLSANAFGEVEDSVHKFAVSQGVDLSQYKGMDKQIRRYLLGKLSYAEFGAPATDEAAWKRAKVLMIKHKKEFAAQKREVLVRLESADLPRIKGVWVLDAEHGNPMNDSDYRAEFERWGPERNLVAAEQVLDQLRREGVSQEDQDKIAAAMRDPKNRAARRQVPAELAARSEATFRRALKRLKQGAPEHLIQHPATHPFPIPEQDWPQYVRQEADNLVLELPPFTAVLVELDWGVLTTEANSADPSDPSLFRHQK